MSPFVERLRAGDLLVGTFVSTASPAIASILAESDLDWIVIDAEHGVPDLHAAALCVQIAVARLPVLVRAPLFNRRALEALLDAGATGVILPRIGSTPDARAALAATSYGGGRGLARTVPRWHWGADTSDALAADSELVRIIQIETVEALDAVAEIARLDGVDALFLGPADLGLDLQRKNRTTSVAEAADAVAAAASAAGKVAATLLGSADELETWVRRGYRLLAVSGDVRLVGEGARAIAEAAAAARSAR